jgi:hypothetical protein
MPAPDALLFDFPDSDWECGIEQHLAEDVRGIAKRDPDGVDVWRSHLVWVAAVWTNDNDLDGTGEWRPSGPHRQSRPAERQASPFDWLAVPTLELIVFAARATPHLDLMSA